MGWWDDSVGKAGCYQAGGSEFSPGNLCDRNKEQTHANWPLRSHLCVHTYTHAQ